MDKHSSPSGHSSDPSNETLTDRQGHPITDNQNVRTVGSRGPTTLENYHFLEKITHFDRERIPERVVHARGAGAHGVFEAYGTAGNEPVSKYTRARLFQEKGKQTPVFVRFSTVIHGGHSPETLRDPRGFAVKFYTEDGNWDLVGNNLKIFFIRDPLKFPDMVHAFKPDPLTNAQDMERFFDFVSLSPEATHMVTFLFSPWGIPANYRQMQGSGVNTYKWVNQDGKGVLIKYHWEPLKQGIRKLLQGRTFSYSDTQRHRVGANYLQLPVNAPKNRVATNQSGGQMQYKVDRAPGQNPHVNYEPSSLGGLTEAQPRGKEHEPLVEGHLVREKIERTNDFGQAGDTYRAFEDWERDELISNMVGALAQCKPDIRERMISHFTQADADYGRRVAEGLATVSTDDSTTVQPKHDPSVEEAEKHSRETDGY
ncbi:catalase [Paenibacillus sp. JGP012]|nr:catalase [Paenibacillus sp. JGP012]MBB6022923.1 catalase [Paenibacillus sp. JGP012]